MENELLDGFYLKDLFVKPTTGQVTSAQNTVHLPPKAMEVLLYIARHSRHLVTREEILSKVWGDGHGSADALTHAIGEIRHALDDHATDPDFIQTVPRRGYRLLVEPQTQRDASELSASSSDNPRGSFWKTLVRHGVVQAGVGYLIVGWLLIQVADATFGDLGFPSWTEQLVTYAVVGGFPIVILLSWFLEFGNGKLRIDDGNRRPNLIKGFEQNYLAIIIAYGIAGLGAAAYQSTIGFESPSNATSSQRDESPLAAIADGSLAVLKLVTFGDDARLQMLSSGISEDLIDALAKVPRLFVSSRGDAWSLPANATSDQVRRRLRVARFVEGSIRMTDDDSFRVVVQLVDSESGFHIVSRGFEFDLDSYASANEEVTNLIVANLRLGLDSNPAAADLIPTRQAPFDAYISYRSGLEELYKPRSLSSISAALEYFSEALNIDSDYPAAHAGRCAAFTIMYRMSRDAADIVKAEEACAEAYAVGPQLPIVLTSVGDLYLATGKHELAQSMFENCLAIDDRYVGAIRGLALVAERELDFKTAERLFKQAIELQPGNWRSMNTLASLYFGDGRYADAADVYREALFIEPDNFAMAGNLGAASLMAGDFTAARDAMNRSLEMEFDSVTASNLGIVYYYLGDFTKSVELHRRVVEAAPNSSGGHINLADALRFKGDDAGSDAAFREAIRLARADLQVYADDPEALTYLAWGLTMIGETEDGMKAATKALQIDQSDPYSHYYLGLIQLQANREDAAIDAFATALQNGYEATMLNAEPYLATLKENSRYGELLEQYDQ